MFFALEVNGGWFAPMPEGRILKEEHRHLTLAFLGNESWSRLQNELKEYPFLKTRLGLTGRCDGLLFLPERHPRVVAGHITWIDLPTFQEIHQELSTFLRTKGYILDPRELVSHVTLARAPFQIKKWKEVFTPFPLIATSLNLYESVGNLAYRPLWTLPLRSPIEFKTDLIFEIRGKDYTQLFHHAQLALAFKFPQLLNSFLVESQAQSDEELISQLMQVCQKAVCPIKALQFQLKETSNFLLGELSIIL